VILSIGIPLDYAFAAVEQTMTRNLILIGVVTLLALLAAWFFGDVFVGRPIAHLVKTTQSLAAGDFSARTNAAYGRGEFGALNRSVDDMAQALSDRDAERRQAEAAIRDYAENLERSNRDLMDFANIASHDLQEPLRKISTFSDILLIRYSGTLDRQGKDYLHRIHASTRRMQSFIIDLLTFSRISTKTKPPEKVNLNEIIHQVLGDLEIQIAESDAKVNVGDLPLVYADPVQMNQLFLNLISNSLKFKKPETPVVIQVSGEVKYKQPMIEGDGKVDFCEVRISDNGIGFDEKYLDRIFQPFQRLHPNEYEGTGMGLAICRKIIERHGGIIEAHSKPDQGALFITRLPIQHTEGSNP
jgi:light-regulated signal transduction histidine kinase (bacteriophytochrome)